MISKKKYYLIIVPLCWFLSIPAGILFSTPNYEYLSLVSNSGLGVAKIFAENSPEEYYDFNAGAQWIFWFLFIGIAIFIRNTIYYDKISGFFKSIKRA